MNTTTPRLSLTYLIVASFIFAASLIIASMPLIPSEITSNEAIFGDCEVQDITWKYDDERYRDYYVEEDVYGSEENETILRCEVGLRRFEVQVLHEEPDQIRIDIYLDRDFKNFKPVLNDSTAPSLTGHVSDNNSSFKSEELGRVINQGESDFWFKGFKQVKVKIDSKESYKPKDILSDFAEDDELIFEYKINAHQHVKTLKFDGAKNAVKEFRKRFKSLQNTSNED
ncbi:MAG: hypothetical protein F4039_04635 [Gammaproteobacteria bacterium]|nr:hypothetical protein [Gammaproteobacteria bacterium]MYF52549.1 hypothetical protein [Gammaproteobacteria bacterium]MYK43358.1 hypothetical protein [Gammaproteobacteria bacterium]